MITRTVRARTTVIAAAGLSLALMSPVWADCCSSILGCVATYVTDGLSCEIETIIDTINSIANLLNNFVHDVDGQTQAAQQAAQQSVTDTYNALQSQSQQSDADLAAALSQATTLFKEETSIQNYEAQSIVQSQNQLTAPASGKAAPQRPPVEARADTPATGGGPPMAMTAQRSQDLSLTAGPGNPMTQKSAVEVGTQVHAKPDFVTTPKGSFADAFSRAIQQITVLKSAGDADFSKVNGYLTQAKNSEGPGISAANTVAGVIDSPLAAMQSQLSHMLANPWSAFDPTSVVDQIENTVTADLSVNISQMVTDITTGPNDAFNAAQPSYDDLLANAQAAQALVAVMTDAYQRRTTAAANALYEALPKRQFLGLDSKGIAGSALAANNMAAKFGKRQPFSVIAARMSTVKQRVLQAYKAPDTRQIHVMVAQFKAQRAQGKSLPPATLAGYKNRLPRQFDDYFNGKSATAIAGQRDQLISQARAKYAKDPATANAVVSLLNSEASKRAGLAGSTTTNPTVRGQPVATTPLQRTAVSGNPQGGLAAPAASINQTNSNALGSRSAPSSMSALGAPPSALGATAVGTNSVATATAGRAAPWTRPAAANSAAPIAAATPAQAPAGQVNTSVWGAAPVKGWTMPAAAAAPATSGAPVSVVAPIAVAPTAVAPTAVNSAVRLQTVKPAQQQSQQIQAMPAQQANP